MSLFREPGNEALKRFPAGTSLDGDDCCNKWFRRYRCCCIIWIAVLVVPVLRDTDRMSMADVESRIRELGGLAQKGWSR